QAKADLQESGEAEREPEQGEGHAHGDQEAAYIRLDLVRGPGDADDEAAILTEVDIALDDAKLPFVGGFSVAATNLAEGGIVGPHQARKLSAEKGFRRADLARGGI